MPFPFLAAATIGSSLIGSVSQGLTNRANQRRFRENRRYNEPKYQMERLKAAGLNPNLVYGQGANNVSSPPPQNESKTPDLGSAMAQYQNIKNAMKNELVLDQKYKNSVQELELKKMALEHRNFDLDKKKSLLDSDLSFASNRVGIQKLDMINKEIFNSNLDAKMKSEILGALERAKNNRANTNLTDIKTDIQQELYDRWYSKGINPNDSLASRKILELIDALFDGEPIDKIKTWRKNRQKSNSKRPNFIDWLKN